MGIGKTNAMVRKLAEITNIETQVLWDMYFFEHFLYRLTHSGYENNFVFKGGFLLQSIIGFENRSTMDVDLKVQSIELSDNIITKIFTEIINIDCDDGLSYKILGIDTIAKDKRYGGKSVKIFGQYYNIKKTFNIDLATGDVVTPFPIRLKYYSKITDLEFEILSYSKETILAEKFETLVIKGTNNSRVKDILDIYLLVKKGFDEFIFNSALINTFYNRNTILNKDIKNVVNDVLNFNRIMQLYDLYMKKHTFAQNISFDECVKGIYKLIDCIEFNEPIKLLTDVTLVRHGQDEQDKVGGWSDNHLTNEGIKEVEELIYSLDNDYDLILSSDSLRTKETTELINKKLKIDVVFLETLRETNNGSLKNLTKEQAKEKFPGLYFNTLKMDETYPNCESPLMFYERVKNSFLDINKKYIGKKVLIVTHGGVITVIMCLINGLMYSNLLKITPKTGSKIMYYSCM